MDSPVWRLIHALSTMTDETGNKISIKNFYDDVADPPAHEKRLIAQLAKTFDPRPVKELNKVSRFSVNETNRAKLLKAYFHGTTLNIDGIWGGYIGPGSKTVLPHKVTAKLDAYGWAQTDLKSDIAQAVIKACRSFGYEPELWPRIGGSAPFYLFTEVLKIPFAEGVLGHGGRAHSPDEYIV